MDRMRELIVAYRRALVIVAHLLMWSAALGFALLLRFEFEVPSSYGSVLPKLLVLSLAVRSIVHWRLGLFHGLWRYSGSRDLRTLVWAATLSSVAYAAAWGFFSAADASSRARSSSSTGRSAS